jgi:SAM-dependent methyltransferase
MFSSAKYWDDRYRGGGNSGSGSYGKLAEFKAGVVNNFIEVHQIKSVIDFGCGDGNQLGLFKLPAYLGVDVSKEAIGRCSEKFKSDTPKEFLLVENPINCERVAELTLSLDVIFHLVEDRIYLAYMEALFNASQKFVIIYSSNFDKFTATHEREREFTSYVQTAFPKWKLLEKIENPWPYPKHPEGSLSDFYIYSK